MPSNLEALSLDQLSSVTGGLTVRSAAVMGAISGATYGATYAAGALAAPGVGLPFFATLVAGGAVAGAVVGAASAYGANRIFPSR